MPETAIDRAAADIPLTRSARDVLERAAADAARRAEPEASPVDVLRAVLGTRGSLADQAMRELAVDPAAVLAAIPPDGARPQLPLRQLLVNANREAQVLGHYQVDSIHLLLALLYSDARPTSALLQQAGLTLYDLRRHVQTGVRPDAPLDRRPAVSRPPDRALRRRPLPSLRGVLGVSPLFLGIVALVVVSGAVLWINPVPQGVGIATLVFVMAAWVASVCVHEFFHAVVAYLGGDRTVAGSGYLRLDPLRYTHILMSIVFPVVFLLLGGIALPGGAVYIDRGLLRSRWWDSAVSLAGPVGTLVCGLIGAGVFFVLVHLQLATATNIGFLAALAFFVFVQMFSLIINLVPIPPLDGFGIIRPWLPYSVQAAANRIASVGIVLIFVAIWYIPPAGAAINQAAQNLAAIAGIDPYALALGALNMPRFR
jgi:Zn-dependent protease